MAKLNETMGKNIERQMLANALNRICERIRSQFLGSIKIVGSTDPDTGRPVNDPFLCVVEETKKKWLGIFTKKQRRMLFFIDSGFWGGALGEKEIKCEVYDRSILDIIKEEIQKYADEVQATSINLKQEFTQ